MKRIVRLTESDLTRIVRRVIRENEWSDEDEMELQDIKSKAPYLDDFDGDIKSWQPEFEKWRDEPRHMELSRKKQLNRIKNLPPSREKGPWSDEEEMEYQDIRSRGPKLDDFGGDIKSWEPEFEKWRDEPRHMELSRKKRKSY
jgi:hypothetical protein